MTCTRWAGGSPPCSRLATWWCSAARSAPGKTTLVQGIGQGLGVRGPVTSPTFVIARVHPALGRRPGLVHVDAYRLASVAEVDDLDLDASLDDCVTVVEWGAGPGRGAGRGPARGQHRDEPGGRGHRLANRQL